MAAEVATLSVRRTSAMSEPHTSSLPVEGTSTAATENTVSTFLSTAFGVTSKLRAG